MKILIACEYSGTVREAFSRLGHDVTSCDLLSTDVPGSHYQGDVKDIIYEGWDMVIAHPPCTRLANSGVRWLKERNLWNDLKGAIEFFRLFQDRSVAKYVCIENPIPHKYAVNGIEGKPGIGKYSQIIQPWQYGHGETKATCLWLYGLPNLQPTDIVEGREQKIWKMPPTKDRWKLRSKTYTGIAQAMADQWGSKIETSMIKALPRYTVL